MRYKIDDIATLIMDYRGKTPKKLGMDWTENSRDILAISAKNIKNGRLINKDKAHYGDENLYKKWMKDGDIKVGDILMTSEAPLGESYLITKPLKAILSQRTFLIRLNKELADPWFFYSLIQSPMFKMKLLAKATGTTVIGIKQKELRKIIVDLPSLNIQKKIGYYFKVIDQKIRLNNQINDNLISLATTLFNKYFPNINSGNEMIGNFISNYDRLRKPLSKKERLSIPGKYRYIGATSVNDYINKYNFDGIYLLLGEDGTVEDDNGYPILQYISGKFWPNNHAHVLQGKNVSTEWLYLFFKQRKITSIVTGAVQKKISQKNLNSLSISIPDKDKLARFDTIINPIFKNIRIIESENHSLEKIKVELLSKLF